MTGVPLHLKDLSTLLPKRCDGCSTRQGRWVELPGGSAKCLCEACLPPALPSPSEESQPQDPNPAWVWVLLLFALAFLLPFFLTLTR